MTVQYCNSCRAECDDDDMYFICENCHTLHTAQKAGDPETVKPRIVKGWYWCREVVDDSWSVAYITQNFDDPYEMHFIGQEEAFTQPGFIVGPRVIPPAIEDPE